MELEMKYKNKINNNNKLQKSLKGIYRNEQKEMRKKVQGKERKKM
jgi:hypothetical protein